MTARQTMIICGAPKFRKAFRPDVRRAYVPDTPNSLRVAGALGYTSVSALSFYRFDPAGNVFPYFFGDFVGTVSGPGVCDAIQFLRIMLFRLGIFSLRGIVVTYFGGADIEVSIPASFFKKEEGALFLDYYYSSFAKKMTEWAREEFSPVSVRSLNMVRPLTLPLRNQTFPVPRTAEEIFSLDITRIHALPHTPRSIVPGPIEDRIRSDLNFEIAVAPPGPGPRRSVNLPSAIPLNGDELTDSGFRCAKRLQDWYRNAGIGQFRRRDALRAVDCRRGDGMDAALAALEAHGHILECPFPRYDYPGRRPSPWYVVNPYGPDGLTDGQKATESDKNRRKAT